MTEYSHIILELSEYVGVITFHRPPLNYFNVEMMAEIVDALTEFDNNAKCRATVLCSQGDVFCAGGEFGKGEAGYETHVEMASQLYIQAMKLFDIKKPIIAAVQGAAIGGGLGLAVAADFRVSCASAKFSANFSRLGIFPGFGLSATLPHLIGDQNAKLMFYTARRIGGLEALKFGLVDQIVGKSEVKATAIQLANEIATSSPAIVQDIRASLRDGFTDKIRAANEIELANQKEQMKNSDFIEGITATQERRSPKFSDL